MKSLSPNGLTALSTEELKKLLGHCYRDELAFPITVKSLACVGFQYKQESILDVMRHLDKKGATAVLICVIAERLQSSKGNHWA